MISQLAYLGPEGTFSGILARKHRASSGLVPCPTIEAVFDCVLGGAADAGLVPVENSSGGAVYDTIDLLIRHAGTVHVREELSLDIRIGLLGRAGEPVECVFSHFTQIKHHSAWLAKAYPEARLVTVESTALAVRKAAETPRAAALAAPATGELHGLDVLALPALAGEVNVTHFFVIAREAPGARDAGRTGLVAALPNECGSLHAFLGPFAQEQVSLTRIISRPVPGQPQTYVFYVEIEGGLSHPATARAVESARPLTRRLVPLGNFLSGPRYSS